MFVSKSTENRILEYQDVRKTLHRLRFALNAVIIKQLFDKIWLKCVKQPSNIKTWFDEPVLFDEKFDRHQTSSNSIFVFFFNFSKKSEFDDQLKCVKLFIKLASLMEFDEQFDTFAHGLRFQEKGCIQ